MGRYRRGRRAGGVDRGRARRRGRPRPTRSRWTSRRSHAERRPLPRHRDPRARQGRLREDPRRARDLRASRSSPAAAPACSSSPRPRVFGATFAWLAGHRLGARSLHQARDDRPRRPARRLRATSSTSTDADVDALAGHLIAWKPDARTRPDFDVSLVGDFYELLDAARRSPTGTLTDALHAQPARHARPLHQRARRLRDR